MLFLLLGKIMRELHPKLMHSKAAPSCGRRVKMYVFAISEPNTGSQLRATGATKSQRNFLETANNKQ
jgi:hypothetical protein